MSSVLLVTVMGPEGPVDVSIRSDRTVADLVAASLSRMGVREPGGSWVLTATGLPLSQQASLRDCRIASGSVLELRATPADPSSAGAAARGLPTVPPWRAPAGGDRRPSAPHEKLADDDVVLTGRRASGVGAIDPSVPTSTPSPPQEPAAHEAEDDPQPDAEHPLAAPPRWPPRASAGARARIPFSPRPLAAAAVCLVAALAVSAFVLRSVRSSGSRTATGAAPRVGPSAVSTSPPSPSAPASAQAEVSSTPALSSSTTTAPTSTSSTAPPPPTAAPLHLTAAGLLPNPGFEAGTTGWSAGNGATILSLTPRAHTGASALAMTRAAGAGAGDVALDDAPDATPSGARCSASAWILAPRGATVILILRAGAPSGAFASQQITLTGASGLWQQIALAAPVTLPPGATTLDLRITGAAFEPGAQLPVDDVVETCA